MQSHKRLGNTDIIVPILGLGTVKIGRNQEVKYPNAFSIPDDQAVIELLATAKDLGVNFIDTAPAYGTSEERLGKLLPGKRDEWVIMSKAGEDFYNGESSFDFSPKAIAASVKRSLKRLKTDYLDIVLIHSNGEDEKIIESDDVFGTLSELKQQGYLRSFGMSTKTIEGGRLCVEHADVAMVAYNLQDQECLPVIEYANELKKGILIKKAFASGHALNNPSSAEQTCLDTFKLIFENSAVASIIVGTLNPLHLRQNWEAALGP